MPKTKKFLALAVATAIAGTTMLGVTSATSDYMHYQDGTISICDPSSNGTKCITMQDKNLGATKSGTGCSAIDTGVCGNHYQWGNNHGFAPNFNWNATFPGGESTSNSQINCSDNSRWNPVNSSAFIVGYADYCTTSTRNDKLRGGANDNQSNNRGFDETNNKATNVGNRRGPCEDGYHVPSIGERGTLLKYWAANYTGAGNTLNLSYSSGLPNFSSNATAAGQFHEDFKIPFAGRRDNNDAKVYSMGYDTDFWSSSPRVGSNRASDFYLTPNEAHANYDYDRAIAFSLRCFKDSYLEFPSSEGEDGLITVNIAALNGGQNTCTLDNYIFSGIFASPSVVFRNISQSMYCIFGDAGSKAVTLELSGNLTDGSGNIIPGGNVRLKNSAWTATPSGIQTGNTAIAEYTGLNKTITLFNKVANKIGEATGAGVDIQIEVPGGTPNGVYNGVLVLSY